jgi:hypothetical protein
MIKGEIRRILRAVAIGLVCATLGQATSARAESPYENLLQYDNQTQLLRGSDPTHLLIRRYHGDGSFRDTRVPITIIPKGTTYYHWQKESPPKWVADGHITNEDARFFVNDSGGRAMVSGGGVYGSPDSWDTHAYGPNGAAFEMPQDIASVANVDQMLKEPRVKDALARAGIHAVSNTADPFKDWVAFIDGYPLFPGAGDRGRGYLPLGEPERQARNSQYALRDRGTHAVGA